MKRQPKAIPPTTLAHLKAHGISRNLEDAIANYEMFVVSGTNEEIINSVNKKSLNPGLNVISASLHHVIVISLCRIWDTRSGVDSIPSIKKLLRKDDYKLEHAKLAEKVGNDNKYVLERPRYDKLLDDIHIASQSDSLSAITLTRNNWLAHSASRDRQFQENARAEVYGDERKVIELTIPLVESINYFVGFDFHDLSKLRTLWNKESTKFWNTVAFD